MNTRYSPEQELKFHILAEGIRISDEATQAWGDLYTGPVSLNEYASTSGVCLEIIDDDHGIWVNAPYEHGFTARTDTQLRYDGGFVLERADIEFPVKVIPVPAYHSQMYVDNGVELPYTNLGVTHTDRVRISPIEGCGMVCKFCNIPYELRYRKKPLNELLRVIEIAKDDPQTPARHVLISGGTPRAEDEDWEDDVYESVIAKSPLPVDIMMTPREDPAYLRRLRDAGVNSLSVNLEVFDPVRARKLIPSKSRRFGPDRYLDYIGRAVEELGVGRVQSLVLIGESIEPMEGSLAGVRALADRGCIPVLSPFRPDARTPMENDAPTSEAEMREIYERSQEICEKAGTGVKPGPRCVPCHHNTVTMSDGSDFYIPLNKEITSALDA